MTWRHELAPPPNPARFGEREIALDRAWRSLLLIHTNFRAPDPGEYRELVEGLRGIDMIFMERPELSTYYEECNREIGSPVNPPVSISGLARHLAAVQARFMERVFYVLQLARYSNALDNRGWMNLFRAWAQSSTFQNVFRTLRSTFAEEFVKFYELYISSAPGPIEAHPVPHPWDAPIETGARLDGIFLDSGLHHTAPRTSEPGGPLPSPGSGSYGVKDEYMHIDLGTRHESESKQGPDASSARGESNS